MAVDYAVLADQARKAAPASDPPSATAAATPLVTQMGERPVGGYEMSETPPPAWASSTLDALRSVAHPQTAGDLLSLALPNATLGAAGDAAIHAASTTVPSALVKTGSTLQTVGQAGKVVSPYALVEAAIHLDPKGVAVAAAPYVTDYLGSLLKKAGLALTPAQEAAIGQAIPALTSTATETTAKGGSALNYLTGTAMVDATPQQRMLLARQRIALRGGAK